MPGKLLYTASTYSHIANFHLPYLRAFREAGWTVHVACGGTELGGMDYIIARKVLKKFESMNVNFVRDEITGLIEYIEKLFGAAGMPDSVDYLRRIQNLY